MCKKQKVAEMVAEVLPRQAKSRAKRSGEPFEEALEDVMDTEAGRQLKELHNGPHRDERAQEWQESLARERADAPGWSSPNDAPGLPSGRPTAGSPISSSEGNASVPEAWIGQAVELVSISGASTEYTDGILQEVNDRGIVLSVETHVGHSVQSLFYPWIFYPWSAVTQLSEGQDG